VRFGLGKKLSAHGQDQEDRRCKRGKYAPPIGVCVVCSSPVVARVAFQHNGMVGGPPPPGYIAGYHCERCGIEYHHLPPKAP
jgi:hypothetical protein